MPYITPEDMTPGVKLLITDVADIIAEQTDITAERVKFPHADDTHLGPRARQAEVITAELGMHTELDFDGPSYEVTLKLPGRKHPVTVQLGADWMIRQPISTTY